MPQKPLAMAFCSSLFTCSCWMVENIGKKGHRLWAVRGERSQSLLMTHCNDDCNPIIRDQRVSGSLVPFLLQSISSSEEREIGSSIKENVFGGIFFSSPKVSFPCEFFFYWEQEPFFVFLKLWIANSFPLPFFTCKYFYGFSGNRSRPLWAAFTTWLLSPLPRTSVMNCNMPARQGLEAGRWVSQRGVRSTQQIGNINNLSISEETKGKNSKTKCLGFR